jgi:hypothetical protein
MRVRLRTLLLGLLVSAAATAWVAPKRQPGWVAEVGDSVQLLWLAGDVLIASGRTEPWLFAMDADGRG